MNIDPHDPLATATKKAIETGDIDALKALLADNPGLATARIAGGRTVLHVVTDWPGHFPNGVATVNVLVAAGADVNAHSLSDAHDETPLHWAASSDDVDVLDALLDNGADIEATGSVIDGGTALSDAVAFGQWKAARRLIERGAKANLWQAAALGLMDRVEQLCGEEPMPARDDLTNAFWCACHGSQRTTAEYLLSRGAELNWIGHDKLTPLDTALRSGADELANWLRQQGAKSASEL